MSEDCQKEDHNYVYPNPGWGVTIYGYKPEDCPYCEIDRLTAKLAEVREEAKVWQDRYRKRGYVMDEHAKALERAEVAEAECDRYKEALEILSSIYFYGNFKPETYNESLLEQMLTQFGLWPTTEDEIIKRSIAREALKEEE